MLGDQYPNTGTEYTLPKGGHVEIGTGLGLYLIRMGRNGVSSIIENMFGNIIQVTFDAANPNSQYMSFEKVSPSGGMNFYINEIYNEDREDYRKIYVRKVF